MQTTFTVAALTFCEAAKGVALAAGTDTGLPTLMLAQIEVTPAAVIFRATDRYRVHEATVKAENPGVELAILVPAKWLKETGAAVAKSKESTVVVTVNDGAVRVAFGDDVRVTLLHDVQFPGVAKLYEAQTTGEIASIALNPKFLADLDAIPHADFFGKGKHDAPMTFTFGATASKPVRVTFELHDGHIKWDCLIMPIVLA